MHDILQVCALYHFTDELTKDMREGRGWYAAWDVWRRLFFIILFYVGVYFDSSLVSVSTHTHAMSAVLVQLCMLYYNIICTRRSIERDESTITYDCMIQIAFHTVTKPLY